MGEMVNQIASDAIGRDGVISFPTATVFWPVADLPGLIADALVPDGRRAADIRDHVAAEHRAEIQSARVVGRFRAVSATTRLPADCGRSDVVASIEEIEKYVKPFCLSVILAGKKWY